MESPVEEIITTRVRGSKKPLESSPVIKIKADRLAKIHSIGYKEGADEMLRVPAINKSVSNTITSAYNKKFKLLIKAARWEQLETHFGPATISDFQEIQQLEDELEIGCPTDQLYGYWITICPAHDFVDPVDTLKRCCAKLVSKKGIIKYLYCLEQTGTGETLGKHPHAHILVERNPNEQTGQPKKLKTGILNTINSHFKNQHNTKIQITKIGRETARIRYCMGQKKKEFYNPTDDYIWRRQNGLEDYYTNIRQLQK